MAAPAQRRAEAPSVTREGGRVAVGGRLDFASAREVLDRVSSEIESASEPVTVDLGGVTSSNSAGLALLVEWLAVGRRAGRAVRLANVPDGLVQLARVCQVDALIGAATVPAAG